MEGGSEPSDASEQGEQGDDEKGGASVVLF